MPKPGWESVTLDEETLGWIDAYIKDNLKGAGTRAGVIRMLVEQFARRIKPGDAEKGAMARIREAVADLAEIQRQMEEMKRAEGRRRT